MTLHGDTSSSEEGKVAALETKAIDAMTELLRDYGYTVGGLDFLVADAVDQANEDEAHAV